MDWRRNADCPEDGYRLSIHNHHRALSILQPLILLLPISPKRRLIPPSILPLPWNFQTTTLLVLLPLPQLSSPPLAPDQTLTIQTHQPNLQVTYLIPLFIPYSLLYGRPRTHQGSQATESRQPQQQLQSIFLFLHSHPSFLFSLPSLLPHEIFRL